LDLSTIYASVQKELAEVEGQFQLIVESERTTFPNLHQMLSHVLIGGKIIRPALTLLSGKFYKYDTVRLLPMATASELLHIATLVHDDAIDKSDVRRWRQTVNKIWGEDKAILLGDFLFAKAGEFAAATDSVRAVRLFTQTLATISRGELRQSFDAHNLQQTRKDYLQRISGKTASLLAMSTETGALLSQAPDESVKILRDYGYNLGIAFQIVDDILDFIGSEDEMGKPVGSDLSQGTLTLPAMLILERYPEDNPVKRLFQGEDTAENIKQSIELGRDPSIINQCYELAAEYRDSACQNLKLLPSDDNRQALIGLADYVVRRKK